MNDEGSTGAVAIECSGRMLIVESDIPPTTLGEQPYYVRNRISEPRL